jgi:hypothetical protein
MKTLRAPLRQIPHRAMGSLAVLIILGLLVIPAAAQTAEMPPSPHHTWDNFHWATTPIQIGNNLSGEWTNGVYPEQRDYLEETIKDWNDPAYGTRFGTQWSTPVITLVAKPGSTRSAKTCKPVAGRIEVCNYAYGKKNWLGITYIWTSGDHITQATSKLNDSYYADPTSGYNTPAERLSVICHELAHGFGLDHWDEDTENVNTGSCMDYSNNAAGGGAWGPSDEHPHYLDFQDLDYLYKTYHDAEPSSRGAESTTATAAMEADPGEDPSAWGEVIARDDKGRPHKYRKNLGQGKKLYTFVLYTDEAPGPQADAGQTSDGAVDDAAADTDKKDKGKKSGKAKKGKGSRQQGRR